MKKRSLCLVALILPLFVIMLGSVNVQAENVSVNVTHPDRMPATLMSRVTVNMTVDYSGGTYLVIGIKNSTGYYVGALIDYYPLTVIRQINCYASECHVELWHDAGEFYALFGLYNPTPNARTWNLEGAASLADENYNQLNSTANMPFDITVYDLANVYVNAPSSVVLNLDGMPKGPGSFQVPLVVGSMHNFSLPEVVSINDTSRLVLCCFNGDDNYVWVDQRNPADYAVAPVYVYGDYNLTAGYMTEYKVAVSSIPFNASMSSPVYQAAPSGLNWSGWVIPGASVEVWESNPSLPMSGVLGFLGAREIFDGWSVNDQPYSNTPYLVIQVSGPLTIEPRWHDDYGMAFYAVVIAIVCLSVPFMYVRRRRTSGTDRSIYANSGTAPSSRKEVALPASFHKLGKLLLACILIALIVAGASLEYPHPQQQVTVTTTAFIPETVTVTKIPPKPTGGLQFNGSIGYSGVGKSQYVIVLHHPANVVMVFVILSQKSLPSSMTSNGAALTALASIAVSSPTSSPFLLGGFLSGGTVDNFIFNFPAGDAILVAFMWFTGRGATTTLENYATSAWTSVNPFSVTQGAGSISGRMTPYFAATWNDVPSSNPSISLDPQIIPVNTYVQSQPGWRQMQMCVGYIADDNSSITTGYSFANAGVGSVAFLGFDPY